MRLYEKRATLISPRREDVRVRGHHVLQRRVGDGPDRAGRRRRDRLGLAAQVAHQQRVLLRSGCSPSAGPSGRGRRSRRARRCSACRVASLARGTKSSSSRRALELIRSAGMVLSVNGRPVSGSRIVVDPKLPVRCASLRDDEVQRLAAGVAVSLVIAEPEHLVALHRPAEARAELVLLQLRLGLASSTRRSSAPAARRRG